MARLTHEEIVDRLTTLGMRFRTVRVQTEGDYLPTDVDWNNKDVLHLNHIHRWVNDVTFVVDRDLQASVSLQKVAGIPYPLVLVHYDNGPNHQTHVVTLVAWTIVTHHEFIAVTPTRTRAVTTYAVGANRFWMLAFPVVRWAIRRNYRQLMAEDVPMRERRGRLRAWGYRFRGDDAVRDIRASVSAAADNVIPPDEDAADGEPRSIPVDRLGDGASVLVGRSDHLGLRLERRGDTLLVHRRMCPHEGAELDAVATSADGCLPCPWHGRQLEPLATLRLAGSSRQVVAGRVQVSVDDGVIAVRTVQAAGSARSADGDD